MSKWTDKWVTEIKDEYTTYLLPCDNYIYFVKG